MHTRPTATYNDNIAVGCVSNVHVAVGGVLNIGVENMFMTAPTVAAGNDSAESGISP